MAESACWVVLAVVAAIACNKSNDKHPLGGMSWLPGVGAERSASAPNAVPGAAKGANTAAVGSAAASAPVGRSADGSAARAGAAAAQGSAAAVEKGGIGSAVAAAGAAAAGSAAAPEGFKVGDRVMGQWTDGYFYPGRITKINSNGTYRVEYDDWGVSPALKASQVRPKSAKRGGGSKASASKRGGDSEKCPGDGWVRCNGNCVPLQDDRYNCGACGHVCPKNMSLCRNGVCDCTQYDKDENGVCRP
jgi:hypothetical protein